MKLTPEQLFSLDVMGIPVWTLRIAGGNTSAEKKETIAASTLNDDVAQSQLIVIQSESVLSEQARRLFHAMLYAIDLIPEQVAMLDSNAFSTLDMKTIQNKPVLVLGKSIAASLFDGSLILEKNGNTGTVIVSYTLDELLENNALKAEAWQHLKMIRTDHKST